MMKYIRRFKDLGITGATARWYDKNTREHRQDEMKSYAKEVASHILDGASVLEIAPGPGYLSIWLAKMGSYRITGMDISADFVEIGKANAKRENVVIDFQQGNVSSMPFDHNQFDYIVCSAAFKNFKEPVKALQEMYRVLKPTGTALIIDMNKDASKEALEEEVVKMKLSGFDQWFIKFSFRSFLKQGAYTKDRFETLIAKTRFAHHVIKKTGMSLYVYLYKSEIAG